MLPERAQDLALPECMRFRLAIKKCQPQFIIASSLVINGIIGFDFSADNARISSLTWPRMDCVLIQPKYDKKWENMQLDSRANKYRFCQLVGDFYSYI